MYEYSFRMDTSKKLICWELIYILSCTWGKDGVLVACHLSARVFCSARVVRLPGVEETHSIRLGTISQQRIAGAVWFLVERRVVQEELADYRFAISEIDLVEEHWGEVAARIRVEALPEETLARLNAPSLAELVEDLWNGN